MYQFPRITDIEQVREAIKGKDEFIEADKGPYIVFNYLVNFEDTFPPVVDEKTAILRECRGLIFDKVTGKVISRRYHKFFNLGEKPEVQFAKIDWTSPHVILEKLDGSMITFFQTSDGVIRCGTKMGETGVSENPEKWVMGNQTWNSVRHNYRSFIENILFNDMTPIFEWCSRKNQIVVDYPEDRLVLTAIRDNESGLYMNYDDLSKVARLFDVEHIKAFNFLDVKEALETLSSIKDEGYVVRFENGQMLKMKGEHYLQMHKTMEHLNQEKDLIRLIVTEKLDDAKPFLPPDLMIKVDNFGQAFFENIRKLSNELTWEMIEDFDNTNSKKEFAALIQKKSETAIRFRTYDFMDDDWGFSAEAVKDFVYNEILTKIKNNLSSQSKVDMVRNLWGNLKWEN